MVSHFDPRTGADRSVAHARATHPVCQSGLTSARPKKLHSARNTCRCGNKSMKEFEIQHAKKVDGVAKIMALKSIRPETLLGQTGVFRGRSFNLFMDLRTAIINCLDDKVPVSMMKKGPSVSTTNMVQTLSTGEQRTDEETKNQITQDEIFAMDQQYRKGKGKGRRNEGSTLELR